jgi:hypothetical protein
MTDINLALILLGAFWAGTSSVFAGIKLESEIRNQIIVGTLDDHAIPRRYLWRLLVFHWLPLKLALGIISLVLGAIIIALPDLRGTVPTVDRFPYVCYWAAVMPFLGSLYQFAGAVTDGLFLRDAVRKTKANDSWGRGD